jgi:hypothetical protein
MSLAALGMALLTRVPPGAGYLTDLLPALFLAGVAIGLSAPSPQIGALTGVARRTVGLASGLVETMREIGGAIGIAAASTVLTARTRAANEITNPAKRRSAMFDAFQSAFAVTLVLAVLGVIVAAIAFPRTPKVQPEAVLEATTSPATPPSPAVPPTDTSPPTDTRPAARMSPPNTRHHASHDRRIAARRGAASPA